MIHTFYAFSSFVNLYLLLIIFLSYIYITMYQLGIGGIKNEMKKKNESNPRNLFLQECPCYDVLQETERD